MRTQLDRRSKVWLAFVLVLVVVAALMFRRYRSDRRDYVLLLDAKTGKTIIDLPRGWQLVGETPTQAIVERAGQTKLITLPALPASTAKDSPSTDKAFAVGWSIFPATDMSWLGRPQETTSSGRIAFLRVDGTDVALVRRLNHTSACFSLSLIDTESGNQAWKIETDFEHKTLTPPVATVPALIPPPGPERKPTPTSQDGFPLAPTRIGLTIPPPIPLAPPPGLVGPPPTVRDRTPRQPPDGSYPCPALRGVSMSRTLVGVESDNRFMVFDRATGATIGKPVDATPTPLARLLGNFTVRYDFDNLIAEDPKTGMVAWKLPIPSGLKFFAYQFETSQTNDPYAYFLSPGKLTAIGQDGKIRWATNRGQQTSQPGFIGGSSRVNLTVSRSTVVALTTTGVNGYDPITGDLLWKRRFGYRTLGLQVGSTNRVVAVNTAHYVSD
jgi:PQQ-like domain